MIEEITAYEFIYTPFDRSFPIRNCRILIYATSRKEAELIALSNHWKFFDQDCTCSVTEISHGYRQVEDK